VLYSPKNCAWVDMVMKRVASDNGLNFETDFLAMGNGFLLDTIGFVVDNKTVTEHILNNPNKTQTAIIFTSGK
jgi:hypothetical protein